jgi:ribosomal protein S18 acetylase RimI-like enzyme
MSSNTSTPLLTPSTSQTLPPPSPSPLSTSEPVANDPAKDPLADIPDLNTYVLTDPEECLAALKLIADSIAQQRQIASRSLIFHSITAAVWVVCFAIIYQWLYREPGDIGIMVTTVGGMSMAILVGIRMLTGGYLSEAEKITWEFLKNPETEEEDLLIGSKFGDDIIGSLALRLERAGGAGNKKKGKSVKGGKGVIRAWTTKLKYRGKGIGTELLEEAVKVTREKLGKDAEAGFAADHANSKMLLPAIFNAAVRKREQKAIKLLEEVDEGGKKKR